MKLTKGESQRIYWQQWLSNNNANGNGHSSRRELITSSAAIRINPEAAKAKDVTKLLRNTLNLSSLENESDSSLGNGDSSDSLVLVGTLYSLPKDYIQFEHEPPTVLRDSTTGSSQNGGVGSSSSDPVHVIKTLQPDDNPLATRDKMMAHLKKIQEQVPVSPTTIAPKIQWYFVPTTGDPAKSPIPSSIDLDGYSTSMEEEEDDDDSDTDDDPMWSADETDTLQPCGYDVDLMLSRCPFVDPNTTALPKCPTVVSPLSFHGEVDAELSDKFTKEVQRYIQLTQVQPSCVGYLLKRSSTDPHVWRKVYCVLTDDYLFYTTRIPYSSSPVSTSAILSGIPRMGKKHGRISLGRALLLEPNAEVPSSPLFRIPFSFEVVNSRGTSHIFRANTRAIQRQWIQAMSMKIMQNFENSLIGSAELIVTDENTARNKRFDTLAVEPLFDPSTDCGTFRSSIYHSMVEASVLRLGLDIAEYREQCRQVQAHLPAKQPIIVRTSDGPSPRAAPSPKTFGTSVAPAPIADSDDAHIPEQIRACWDVATKLFYRCTQVALEVQQFSNTTSPNHAFHGSQPSLSHGLETLCRHVDYILTGQRRSVGSMHVMTTSNSASGPGNRSSQHKQTLPPMDLFDLLLSELQTLVRTGSRTS